MALVSLDSPLRVQTRKSARLNGMSVLPPTADVATSERRGRHLRWPDKFLDAIFGYFAQAYFTARLLQYHVTSGGLQPTNSPDSLHSM
jgi:hypothetical protein